MLSENDFIKMVNLDLSIPEEFSDRTVGIRKFTSRITRKAKDSAKPAYCMICGKECTSFCKSHSVPQFALKVIAKNGKICQTISDEILLHGQAIGVGKAGTFFLICQNCDNTRFQQYESPDAYNVIPPDQILAQIALKNYVQMLSKRNEEGALYSLLGKRFNNKKDFTNMKQLIGELDKTDYRNGFYYALKTLEKKMSNRYHLCYYQRLDYVVPYAMQNPIALITDLNNGLINNIYNLSENYHLEFLHLAVFPLKESSIILAFVEQGKKRYRKFFKELHKLPKEEQLSVINYIVFSYTENVFLNPDTAAKLSTNEQFMKICKKYVDVISPVMFSDPLPTAISEFSLCQHTSIPNLLSSQYSLKP